jgi:hypothetical protein
MKGFTADIHLNDLNGGVGSLGGAESIGGSYPMRGGGHQGIGFEFEYLGEFEFTV